MGKNSFQVQTPQAACSTGKAAREAKPPPSPPLTIQEQIPPYGPHMRNQEQKSFCAAKVNISANAHKITYVNASIPPSSPTQWAYHRANAYAIRNITTVNLSLNVNASNMPKST